MKKRIIPTLVLTFTIIGIMISCSKDNSNAKLVDPSNLSEDKAFIELTTETYDYLLFISSRVKTNNLSLPLLQAQLSTLQGKKLPYAEQMANIDIIFKGNLSQRLNEHMKAYKRNWENIKSKYTTITQKILEKECAEVLANKYKKQKVSQNVAQKLAGPIDCGWRYYLCAGAATAGAVLCHAGCDTTALATTAGLGIPVCVALCGTLQTFAIVQCSDSYCTPN